MPRGAERWFHTLVVVGASLGGCGGKTAEPGEPPSPTSTGGAAGAGGSAGRAGSAGLSEPRPSMCAAAAQFVCDDWVALSGCRCDPDAPVDARACASPFDFSCREVPCEAGPNEICFEPDYVACHCDPTLPRPSDCASPEEFFCEVSVPPFKACGCQSPAVDPASCRFEYCCQSSDPIFGCECCGTPIK